MQDKVKNLCNSYQQGKISLNQLRRYLDIAFTQLEINQVNKQTKLSTRLKIDREAYKESSEDTYLYNEKQVNFSKVIYDIKELLTQEEFSVLCLLSEGYTYAEIGRTYGYTKQNALAKSCRLREKILNNIILLGE